MHRVLIVEDEQHLADGLRFNLEAEGYAVDVVETGELALRSLIGGSGRYDLVVLDVMLPGIDGFAVVSELREARNFVPVLMLTARGRPEDVLKGFGAGADDYLPKPTELAILLARIRGLLRRTEWLRKPADRYTFAGKTIDFDTLELRVGDRPCFETKARELAGVAEVFRSLARELYALARAGSLVERALPAQIEPLE